MNYLLTHFWAWGVSAFAVGLATALSISRRPERGPVAGWLVWFGLAFAAGLAVAALGLLPGRAGFWLETALTLFPAFLVGAALGALLGRRSLRDHEGWAVGLLPLALVWLGANVLAGRATEQDLKRRAASAIERVGGDPAYLEVAGRDVLLPRDAANRAAEEEEIAQVPGVRRVVDVDSLSGSAAKSYESAVSARRAARESEAQAPGVPGSATGASASEEPVGPPSAPGAMPSTASARLGEPRGEIRPAPATPSSAAPELARPAPRAAAGQGAEPSKEPLTPKGSAAPAERARPAESGEADVAACQKAVSDALAREPVQFSRGGAGVRRASAGALQKAIAVLQRCPRTDVEVRVRAESGGRAARRLAHGRAARLVDYLARMGVERSRLAIAGEGRRLVSKDAPEGDGGAAVEFLLSPRG